MKIKKFTCSVIVLGLIGLSSAPLASAVQSIAPINRAPVSPPATTIKPEQNDCGSLPPRSQIDPNIECPLIPGTGSNTTGTGTGSSTTTASSPPSLIGQPTAPVPPEKLQDAALMLCEKRQSNINTILSRMVARGNNQVTLFSTIAQRVEAFVTSKNLTVSNYAQLVATITADQTRVESDLATLKANDSFDCTSSNPRALITTFQSDLKQEITDMQTYKTDIMNLIQAVKSVAQANGSSQTGNNGTPLSGGSNQ